MWFVLQYRGIEMVYWIDSYICHLKHLGLPGAAKRWGVGSTALLKQCRAREEIISVILRERAKKSAQFTFFRQCIFQKGRFCDLAAGEFTEKNRSIWISPSLRTTCTASLSKQTKGNHHRETSRKISPEITSSYMVKWGFLILKPHLIWRGGNKH